MSSADRPTCLVTGVAGFIGSHLAEALVACGETVRGIDCFTPFYSDRIKKRNIEALLAQPNFELVEADLRTCDISSMLAGVGRVFHFAGQPGVPASWADGFAEYASCNITATQRLLEAVKDVPIQRLIFASSGSTYGGAAVDLITEDVLPQPRSPYAVTKLTAEHLCTLYAEEWGVPVTSLRFFYVYGPRQRTDVALYRMIDAALEGRPFPLFGDGAQIRDFVHVDDVVRAAIMASEHVSIPPGSVMNICTERATSLRELIGVVAEATGRQLTIEWVPDQRGYVRGARGCYRRALALIGWEPTVALADGVAGQVAWHAGIDRRPADRRG